jgi:PKD repeat protein
VGASLGLNVQKYGRTTALTKGTVTDINATVDVGYDAGTARFVDQIIVSGRSFLKAGDSGSLLVTDPGRNPVGLLFAGPRNGRYGIANRIDLVLSAFNVTVDGGGQSNQPPTADFTFTTDGLTAIFTDASNDPDGTVEAWVWDFGDGNTSTAQNPTHTYAAGGTYTVTLNVTDDDGASDSTSKQVTLPVAGVTVDSVNPNLGNPGQVLNVNVTGTGFQDGAAVDFGERIVVQLVTFVDSSNLVVRIRVHPRAASGPRDVTVTNPDGSSGVLVGGFTVTP